MMSDFLNRMRGNFITQLIQLPEVSRQKGISTTVIAAWLQQDFEAVSILMPILGWRKLAFGGNTFWFEADSYSELMGKIEGHLLSDRVGLGQEPYCQELEGWTE